MNNLTPETLDELRRLYEVAFAVGSPENDWEEWTSKAADAFPALLDAAEERDEIAGRLAHLLCDLTGGRMSKTSYPVPVMAQEIEQYLSECHESDLKDERDALAAAVERVRALHVAARFSGATRWVCSECCIDWPCPTSRALNESEADK